MFSVEVESQFILKKICDNFIVKISSFFAFCKDNSVLLVSAAIFVFFNLTMSPNIHMGFRLLTFVLFLTTLGAVRSTSLRLLLGVPLFMLTAADISLSLYSWFTFRTPFNDGFAASTLDSNWQEVLSMLGLYVRFLVVFFVLTVLFVSGVFLGKRQIIGFRKSLLSLMVVMVVVGVSTSKYMKVHHVSPGASSTLKFVSRFVTYMPFFNLSYFVTAIQESQILNGISRAVPAYDLSLSETGIDTYVLILGESERTANMSIYGYGKPTTPVLEKEISHIKLFNYAISGAPVTGLAVPLALSADTVHDHDVSNYSDNIVNLANQAGFHTVWLSAQTAFGNRGTSVAAIASNSSERLYIKGYDKELLPHLKSVLEKNAGKRNFIVLHLYGSHELACERYPREQSVFDEDADIDSCYDNSVHYTDSLLGDVFDLLKSAKASVFYFSDHGLERDPEQVALYFHGGSRPSKEAIRVPMFIWYSPSIEKPVDTNPVSDLFSTTFNDLLVSSWMGITNNKKQSFATVDEVVDRFKGESMVLGSDAVVHDYHKLPDNRISGNMVAKASVKTFNNKAIK